MADTDAVVTQCKHERGIFKGKLTRFEKFMEDTNNHRATAEISRRVKVIERGYEAFEKHQSTLELLDESEENSNEREIIETRYFKCTSYAYEVIQMGQMAQSTVVSGPPPIQPVFSTVKLPDIDLPKFYGTIETWQSFYDIFKSLVHDRVDLSKTQKFIYLKGCCKDAAFRTIEDIDTTENNYELAINLLKKKFENKRHIIIHHAKGLLFNLSEVQKQNYQSLRKLLDEIDHHISILNKMNQQTEHWDILLVLIILKKLDNVTKNEWDNIQDENNLPKLDDLIKFLNKKCFRLEERNTDRVDNEKTNSYQSRGKEKTGKENNFNFGVNRNLQHVYSVTNEIKCHICNGNHYLYSCPSFVNLPVSEKYNKVRSFRLCTNCLRSGHIKAQCKSRGCKRCGARHNTALHNEQYNNHAQNKFTHNREDTLGQNRVMLNQNRSENNTRLNDGVSQSETNSAPAQVMTSSHAVNQGNVFHESNASNTCQIVSTNIGISQILLSTATVLLKDGFDNWIEATALLDTGSQTNLITEKLCNQLHLKRQQFELPIAGINQNLIKIKHRVSTTLKSRTSQFEIDLQLLVMPNNITAALPLVSFDKDLLNLPKSINLANNEYNVSKPIDLLLGVSLFYEFLLEGKLKLGINQPILIETVLGWIISGPINIDNLKRKPELSLARPMCHLCVTNEELNENLKTFWTIEEIPQVKILSREEERCEEYFVKTTIRNKDGRFIVKLPFKDNAKVPIGDSSSIGLKRLFGLESRFRKDTNLKLSYTKFLEEYENLNHMTFKGSLPLESNQLISILPHHPVIKETSLTTKCRVVFDASAKSTSGLSLNDHLMTGPTVQETLLAIVLRLRLNKIVLNADVKMMFRQVLVSNEERKYQQILWRKNESEPIGLFELNTVTYGTSCAPFLASRCLNQLAYEYQDKYPRTSEIILRSFYMDDLLVSLNSRQEALEVYKELTEVLASAGFPLRKWNSNDASLIDIISKDGTNTENYIITDTKEFKTLGVTWNPKSDQFKFSIIIHAHETITKRTILSTISKIFDPLGLIGPAVIRAKLIIQRLFQLKLDWDDILDDELATQWLNYFFQLDSLNSIEIPRHIICENPIIIELHGFCDASERAYGACIYLVSENEHGQRFSHLLCAKSKVAPLKCLSLPRLELLAACLLAKLAHTVIGYLNLELKRIIFYSDSTIVLTWITIDPTRLKTFVANRVTKIVELTESYEWKHVSSELNAADMISRGISPEQLPAANIWWHGPQFLLTNVEIPNPNLTLENSDLPELKTTPITLITQVRDESIFTRFSRLYLLQRVVARILRFKEITLNKSIYNNGVITVEELQTSLNRLIIIAQGQHFFDEIKALKTSKGIASSSKLLSLHPFIDETGLLRVGGRLRHSNLSFDHKHPIILPYNHHLTHLVLRSEHIQNLHAGAQTLLSIIRLKYWPIKGKVLVKRIIRECVICFKVKPKPTKTFMGDLPSCRITPARPFSKCGVDYAGPLFVKEGTTRNSKFVKAYICIFVCLVIKAVHIELVMDLTTDGFLNALKRFISRRGKPNEIHSDNGSNFLGAHNHFLELYHLLSDKNYKDKVSTYSANESIRWYFIPAKAPHMGGIWESAVKSCKFHLRRVLGNNSIRYEELYTVLTQIEACLNSRPLIPLSDDPNDFLPLTPSHFLLGDSLKSLPQEVLLEENPNLLTRYKRIQQRTQQFWNRWSIDYLHELQHRHKWNTAGVPVKEGSLVVLVEENQPPLRWPMGRIVQLFPGSDGFTRVVAVRLSNGTVLKRSVTKVCVLPINI